MKFYQYIVQRGASYEIIKDNESYGSYSRLSDALYERDRLIQANWSWDDVVWIPDTENPYESMNLPRFTHDYSYIYKYHNSYKVYKDEEYYGEFKSKQKAYDYAKQIIGRVVPSSPRWIIRKKIDGKLHNFGVYKSLEEAKEVKDKLVENGWKQ